MKRANAIRELRMYLDCIKEIIEGVDQRAMAADGPVTPTLKEMTQAEMTEIYESAVNGANRANELLGGDMSFWNYNKYRPTDGGDSRKLVTLMEHDMVWVGIRAFNGATGEWINNGEPERARVLAWMELPQPAQGRWVHGKLLGVEKLSGAAPQGETE